MAKPLAPKKAAGKSSQPNVDAVVPPPPSRRDLISRLGLIGLGALEPVVLASLATQSPLLLIGPHGSAKSLLLERLADALGLRWRHYNAALVNFDDLVGYPLPDAQGKLRFVETPASVWGAQAVFIDEISRARLDVQNRLFPIIHERRVQGIPLPDLKHRWAAMNPPVQDDDEDNGYLGSQRDTFYDLMAESLSFPTWGTADLDDRINAQAIALGLPAEVRDAFKSALQIAYKPGGIGWNTGTQHYYFAEGGWMRVPFKNASGVLQPREYTFGVFNYDFAVQEISGRNAMCDAELALVWDRIAAAMATWDNLVPGNVTSLPGAGCPGSNGTPVHSASGLVQIGSQVNYRLVNTPPSALCVVGFGFDNVDWEGNALPYNMAPLGAPGCLLRIDPNVTANVGATAAGVVNVPLLFPENTSLIGVQLWSQFLVLDPPVNAWGVTLSNAVRTTIGGWL